MAISFHCCTPRMSKYEVLGVSRSASFQELKSAYQSAALATHPDKHARVVTQALKNEVCGNVATYWPPLAVFGFPQHGHPSHSQFTPDVVLVHGLLFVYLQASKRFLAIQEAWETLRDVDLRREYDCRLDLQARPVVVSDEVGETTQAMVCSTHYTAVVPFDIRCFYAL